MDVMESLEILWELNTPLGVNGSACNMVDWWWCLVFLPPQLYLHDMRFLIIGMLCTRRVAPCG